MPHVQRSFGILKARTIETGSVPFNRQVFEHLKDKPFVYLQIFAGRAMMVWSKGDNLNKQRYMFEVWSLTDDCTSMTQRCYDKVSWHEAGILIADNS